MALFFRDDSSGFLGVLMGFLICRMFHTMMFDNRIVYSGLI